MTAVVIVISVLVMLVIVWVAYSNIQEEKKKKERARLLSIAAKDTQANYKALITPLADRGYINSNQRHRLNGIANNFFVFQSVSENNIKALGNITTKMSLIVESAKRLADIDEAKAKTLLESLCQATPETARECTTYFYSSTIHTIIERFEEEVDKAFTELEQNIVSSESETEISGDLLNSTQEERRETSEIH